MLLAIATGCSPLGLLTVSEKGQTNLLFWAPFYKILKTAKSKYTNSIHIYYPV